MPRGVYERTPEYRAQRSAAMKGKPRKPPERCSSCHKLYDNKYNRRDSS